MFEECCCGCGKRDEKGYGSWFLLEEFSQGARTCLNEIAVRLCIMVQSRWIVHKVKRDFGRTNVVLGNRQL